MKIEREELFASEVEEAISRAAHLRRGQTPELPPVSPLRRVLMSSLFFLPLAGFLGALGAWLILEPYVSDMTIVRGHVVLVNSDPFIWDELGVDFVDAISLTVGDLEAIVVPGQTRLEQGVDGQVPFSSTTDISPGEFIEVSGEALDENRIIAIGVRPATTGQADETGQYVKDGDSFALVLLFPLTAVMVALALLFAEGVSSRNWVRMMERSMIGALLTAVFAVVAFVPAGIMMTLGELAWVTAPGFALIGDLTATQFVFFAAARSAAWACIGAATGVGMNLVRSTRPQLRNSVIGGALGGCLGGLFFDPIDRFFTVESTFAEASLSRLVGLLAVGLSVGVFVALVDRLSREAWIRVRTGPLSGKSFVLYRTPTTIGSAPEADIYLFKDAGISPAHAEIHRVGNRYEIEAMDSAAGTTVGGETVRRRRLVSGDQIIVSNTVLEFEERSRKGRVTSSA